MLTCYIMRGLPGSGKSHKARQIQKANLRISPCVIVSADMYYENERGEYNYNAKEIGNAHLYCMKAFCSVLAEGKSVIVDNCNVTRRDFAFYMRTAFDMGYNVEIVYPDTNWADNPVACADKTLHAVPMSVIERMAEMWEK